jgi:hypothetical protein
VAQVEGGRLKRRDGDAGYRSREGLMHTWPELLAHLKHLQKLVVKHEGGTRKELETRIAKLQAQARKMRSRKLEAAKALVRAPLWS